MNKVVVVVITSCSKIIMIQKLQLHTRPFLVKLLLFKPEEIKVTAPIGIQQEAIN